LEERDINLRAAIVIKLIKICKVLRSLNNYKSLMAILSALNSGPVYRLTNTWRIVENKGFKYDLNNLNKLMG
jgi:ribosome-associated toxin RatA of RatAB toxin-antitoxin module